MTETLSSLADRSMSPSEKTELQALCTQHRDAAIRLVTVFQPKNEADMKIEERALAHMTNRTPVHADKRVLLEPLLQSEQSIVHALQIERPEEEGTIDAKPNQDVRILLRTIIGNEGGRAIDMVCVAFLDRTLWREIQCDASRTESVRDYVRTEQILRTVATYLSTADEARRKHAIEIYHAIYLSAYRTGTTQHLTIETLLAPMPIDICALFGVAPVAPYPDRVQ